MITITKEMIEKANAYIPLEEKRHWCDEISSLVIVNVPMESKDKETGGVNSLPDRYEEQPIARQMALAALLAKSYLGIWESDERKGAADYDELLASFIPNQLERMKGDKDVKNKVFDILYDYNEVRKMLNTSIQQKLGHLNDPTVRLMAYVSAMSVEALTQSQKELAEAKKEGERYARARKKKAASEEAAENKQE